MDYHEIVGNRIETLIALDLLAEFIAYNFFAPEASEDLVSAMTIMINEYLNDMDITNIKLDCVYMIEHPEYESIIPVMKFIWSDLDDVNPEYFEIDRAISRIESRTPYKYGM